MVFIICFLPPTPHPRLLLENLSKCLRSIPLYGYTLINPLWTVKVIFNRQVLASVMTWAKNYLKPLDENYDFFQSSKKFI